LLLPRELPKKLKDLKPEGSLLKDRVVSMMERNIIEPRKHVEFDSPFFIFDGDPIKGNSHPTHTFLEKGDGMLSRSPTSSGESICKRTRPMRTPGQNKDNEIRTTTKKMSPSTEEKKKKEKRKRKRKRKEKKAQV